MSKVTKVFWHFFNNRGWLLIKCKRKAHSWSIVTFWGVFHRTHPLWFSKLGQYHVDLPPQSSAHNVLWFRLIHRFGGRRRYLRSFVRLLTPASLTKCQVPRGQGMQSGESPDWGSSTSRDACVACVVSVVCVVGVFRFQRTSLSFGSGKWFVLKMELSPCRTLRTSFVARYLTYYKRIKGQMYVNKGDPGIYRPLIAATCHILGRPRPSALGPRFQRFPQPQHLQHFQHMTHSQLHPSPPPTCTDSRASMKNILTINKSLQLTNISEARTPERNYRLPVCVA